MERPYEYYQTKKTQFTATCKALNSTIERISMIRLWLGIGIIITIIAGINLGDATMAYAVAVLAAVFLFLVRKSLVKKDQLQLAKRHLSIAEGELAALEGHYHRFQNGKQYLSPAHPYSYDLDLFGEHSVFQMLNRTVTFEGNKRLAGQLQELPVLEGGVAQQQQLIHELSGKPEFLDDFRAAGMNGTETEHTLKNLNEWLGEASHFIAQPLLKIAAVAMPLATFLCIGVSVYLGSVWPGLWVVVVLNWALLRRETTPIKQAAYQIGNASAMMQTYAGLLQQVALHNFTHPQLQQQQQLAAASLAHILAFRKLLQQFEGRNNPMVAPVMNSLFLFDIYCLVRLERWKEKSSQTLTQAVAAMIAMDIQVSEAVYAFNHPEFIYPTVGGQLKSISAVDLKHPLIDGKKAVGNSFELGKGEQFYLLTGANMTGKSTFMRTLGVSVVLANMGLPVAATSFSLPLMPIFTSMRITDSVQDDISYFKAELNRLKELMETVAAKGIDNGTFLILLDEPLRGTNSADKQQGTRAIVQRLLHHHAIGIIATHDTILCDMADQYPEKISNYHFESTVSDTGLHFDFTLKQGGSTSNNATILMKQMGIIG